MNDLVRPSSLFTSGRSASAPSGVLATIPNPPPEIARLPAGTAVRGVVVGEDGHGHVLIRTELGTLSVATKAHLAPDTEVILQLRSSGAQLHALIMQARQQPSTGRLPAAPSPAGQTAAPTAAGSGGAGASAGATPPAAGTAPEPPPSGPPDRLSLGQSVRAIIQGPPAGSGSNPGAPPALLANPGPSQGAWAPPGAGLSPLPPGTALLLRILSVSPPAAGGQGSGPAPAAVAAPGTPAAAPSLGGSVAGPLVASPGLVPGVARFAAAIAGPNAAQAVATSGAGHAAGGSAPTSGAAVVLQGAEAPSGAQSAGLTTSTPISPGASDGPHGASAGPATGGSGGTSASSTAAAAAGKPPAALTASPQSGPATTTAQAAPAPAPGPAGGTIAQSAAPSTAGTTLPAPAAAAGPQVFSGQVTGTTHAGHPVVTTPLGTLTLEVRADLPVGGRMALELPAAGLPAGVATESRLAAPQSLGHAWPALAQALELLREQPGPGGAGSLIPHTVPQPGPKLASGILFVLAALTGGEIGAWLGTETVQILRAAGRGGLVDSMARDLGQMGRMAEGVGGDWRLLPIPLWDGDQVRQLRLFLRQRDKRQKGKPADDRDATRFILELEMSRLGEMQFDGLVRARRFDLMLRTRAPLPQPMREDIRQIFQDANDAAGYAGSLGFQASRAWRFVPVEQAGTASAGSGLVV